MVANINHRIWWSLMWKTFEQPNNSGRFELQKSGALFTSGAHKLWILFINRWHAQLFWVEKRCMLSHVGRMNECCCVFWLEKTAKSRLVFLDLHMNFDFDHDTEINMTRKHLISWAPSAVLSLRMLVMSVRQPLSNRRICCFAILFQNANSHQHRQTEFHP